MDYDSNKIEKKWQKNWEEQNIYGAEDFSKKPKQYILVEFPYSSGEGLHVGHCRSYTALDIISRKKRMQGYNVLFPIGWDAFGLPTENYAIKTGIHPKIVTKKNTDIFKRQLKSLGLSFDWSREINTTDPDYYKWTQWIFIQLFKKGLAYKAKMPINWCINCKIGLANEEVVDGVCERCGGQVVKKEKEQWMLKITEYADRLIDDLNIVDYPHRVIALQKDWIGRSEGYEIGFSFEKKNIKVFTTRIDTIFGATYLVVSPEHPILKKIELSNEAKQYIETRNTGMEKEKTGVRIGMANNPATNKEIPVFVADYVLMKYGTGAIMAVPGHDLRDNEFAKKYNLDINKVIESDEEVYTGEGKIINSGKFNGMDSIKAKDKMAKEFKAKKTINYKLRDWVFSRQRYWGEPIPMIKCDVCGWVPDENLPVELPDIKEYKPTDKGESPLAKIHDWVNVTCPKCGGKAVRETDVMPNWAGSNWYFLRYCDPRNKDSLASKKLLKYWMDVDWYNGGMEHSTLHLLYSRFIYKFLYDIKAVPSSEPYKRRTSHGMVLGEGGIKMSKSKGNVINPEEVIQEHGADTLRIYEMFMGPFQQAIAWDTKGVRGVKRFLDKVWNMQKNIRGKDSSLIHKTIKKVGEDIDNMKFNTAVSALMIFVNESRIVSKKDFERFLLILSPFAPHMAEELWSRIGNKKSIFLQTWPEYDNKLIKQEKAVIVIQINGKMRHTLEIDKGTSENKIKELALSSEKIKKHLKTDVKKVIFVKDKLINFVV